MKQTRCAELHSSHYNPQTH